MFIASTSDTNHLFPHPKFELYEKNYRHNLDLHFSMR